MPEPSFLLHEFDRELLADFDGWHSVSALKHRLDRFEPLGITEQSGVYVVILSDMVEPYSTPWFLPVSGAGHFKGRDPTVLLDQLGRAWVDGTQILYFGKAGNGEKGRTLANRVEELASFAYGDDSAAHWGGKRLWHLRSWKHLRVGWRVTADAANEEARLLARFVQHFGARPFANERQEKVRSNTARIVGESNE